MILTPEQLDMLLNQADGHARIKRETGATDDEIREAALDENIEECPCCGWWVEAGELVHPETEDVDGFCCNCRPNPFEEEHLGRDNS